MIIQENGKKRITTRIIHKHDTEENWLKSSFIPKQGEIIVYDVDTTYTYERMKIGDGITNVNDLPFFKQLPKSSEIILPVSNWTGDASPYSQVVTITGATSNMRIDLMPTAVQFQQLVSDSTMLTVENNNSIITVYAIGEKPSVDYSMQAIISTIGGVV